MKFTINPTLPPFYERENRTPPYISYVLHELYPYNIITLHCHKHAEIGICLEGSGYNYIENRIYRFQTGDLQYVSAYTPHLATSDKGVISKWIWISVDILGLLSCHLKTEELPAVSSMIENSFNGTFHPDEHKKLSKIIYELYDSLKKTDNLTSLREFFLVGELLLEAHSIGDIDSKNAPTYKKSLSLYPIILFIRKNYWDKNAMKEENLAKLSKYSVSHFRFLFKKETGVSVQEFILQTRLSYAAYSLKSENASVLDIALNSGFGNISYFNRAFAKYYHCSPSLYRKENK
ncbi:MAG: AraC family transcriptional regulator [Clostridia bacterium]|nr:AraC family transcriptional regulator [Clostridia bacterium]